MRKILNKIINTICKIFGWDVIVFYAEKRGIGSTGILSPILKNVVNRQKLFDRINHDIRNTYDNNK